MTLSQLHPNTHFVSRAQPLLWCALLLLAIGGCKGRTEAEAPYVARVFDEYLYVSDIATLVPPEATADDSTAIVQGYITNWIQQQLILKNAEVNLPEERKNVEKQLQAYRASLLIYAYEAELIRQRLDTNISEAEIRNYYEQNKVNFELKDYIVQVDYLKLVKNSPNLETVREWFASMEPESQARLEDYATKYAVKYRMAADKWIYLDDLIKELPLNPDNKERWLTETTETELEDDQFLYLLRLREYQMKDSISPLSLEEKTIHNTLINQRKFTLISQMKKDLFNDALTKGDFEIKSATQ